VSRRTGQAGVACQGTVYETWARAEELLGLNVEDLDSGKREAIVTGNGGDRRPS
jgi:hypothetical protein